MKKATKANIKLTVTNTHACLFGYTGAYLLKEQTPEKQTPSRLNVTLPHKGLRPNIHEHLPYFINSGHTSRE